MTDFDVLRFVNEEVLRLPGPGPWISVKRFSTSGRVTVDAAMASLVSHPDYLDTYSGDHAEGRAQGVHGPYRADAIDVVDFRITSTADALTVVRSWLEELYDGQEPSETSQSVVDWITPHLASSPLYVLGSLSEADRHEHGWIVGGSGFHEWVAIAGAGLELIVASDD